MYIEGAMLDLNQLIQGLYHRIAQKKRNVLESYKIFSNHFPKRLF